MTAQFPLQSVAELAREEAEAATLRLGQAMARLMEADRKLKTLLQYREEYQARFRDSITSGINSAGWHNFQLFLDKLEAGIAHAREQADRARLEGQQAQAEWQEHQRRLKAYGVLAERHQRMHALREARREQRDTDETASSTFRRSPPPQRTR